MSTKEVPDIGEMPDNKSYTTEIEVSFAKHIKMPEGYKVIWASSCELYLVKGPNDYEDGPYSCRWMARRAAIDNYQRRRND